MQTKMKTANIWEHKVDNNDNINNLEHLWKTRMRGVLHPGLAKLANCNQILGHVADQNYIAFID